MHYAIVPAPSFISRCIGEGTNVPSGYQYNRPPSYKTESILKFPHVTCIFFINFVKSF